MDYLGSAVFLFFGLLALTLFIRERRAKHMARDQAAVSAVVRKVEKSMHKTHNGTERWEILLHFDVLGDGLLTNHRVFDLQADAEQWADAHPVDSKHRVKHNPVDVREVFIEGEEDTINPTGLIAGIAFIGIGIFLALRTTG
jgi:hypothetical protein